MNSIEQELGPINIKMCEVGNNPVDSSAIFQAFIKSKQTVSKLHLDTGKPISADITKEYSRQKMIKSLNNIIEASCLSEEDEDPENMSVMHMILINKLRKDFLSAGCTSEEECIEAAKKVANFIEMVLKETYEKSGVRYGADPSLLMGRTDSAENSEEDDDESEKEDEHCEPTKLSDMESDADDDNDPEENHNNLPSLDGDELSDAERSNKSSMLPLSGHIINITPKDEEVKTILESKADDINPLESASNSSIKEWSNWLLELADKTKGWASWIEDTAAKAEITAKEVKGQDQETIRKMSSEWKAFLKAKRRESVMWKKTKSELSNKASYWNEVNSTLSQSQGWSQLPNSSKSLADTYKGNRTAVYVQSNPSKKKNQKCYLIRTIRSTNQVDK